ncbi:acetolactate synthase large subunit [Candidatus Woesearchaeota archaeon]|nr:acetolactate synthase large subunit [Candidatus Woesearchaeota archaeon]
MNAADVMVRCLENEGVKYIFGLPGEENEDLLMSLAKSSIQFISTRHEQGAAFMADVYGRLTGKAGVCLSTLGPGATNLITGVADANLDHAPLVAITGQGSRERLHKESHQMLDIVQMFQPITKWNTVIVAPSIIPEAVRKAFKLAETEKPGATHIELPEDVAKLKAEKECLPLEIVKLRRPAPDYKALAKALEFIRQAKKPVILAGNGAIRKLASKQLRLFVEKTHIPVVSTFMGKGAISDADEHSLFTLGLQAKDYVTCVFDEADLVITVGYDIVEYPPEKWNPAGDKKIIHIDFTPAEVYTQYMPTVEVVADIAYTLWALNQEIEDNLFPKERASRTHDVLERHVQRDAGDADFPIKPQFLIAEMRKALDASDILISDVGAHKIWIGRNYQAYEPNTCIISNGLASMGIALPGAIAAKLAKPVAKVIAAVGDGGFLMNVQELETAKRLGVAFTVVIFNDNGYGLIEWKQQLHHKKSFGVTLTNPDFVKLAESFGARGVRIASVDELRKALAKAINSDDIWIIDVPVDYQENFKLSDELSRNTCEIIK